jgi:adenylate cyclase
MHDGQTPRTLPSTPIIDWLLYEGAQVSSPGILLGELCRRLVGEGVQLATAVLSIASLDPMVARRRLQWRRSDGRVIEEVQFHGMFAIEAAPAENATLRWIFPGTRHELEWLPEQPGSFPHDQREYLEAICLAVGAPLQVIVGRELTRNLLQAYLGRRSSEKVLSGTVRRGVGETIDAIIWISDLRDFTRMSEIQPLAQVITSLNDYCARLVGAIHPFGGEVLKFMGDGLLAIFPLTPHTASAACDSALAAGRAARQGMERLDQQRIQAGLAPLPFGLALHCGAVMYGNIGAPDRLDFTAIGPAVNLTSRIEECCRTLSCPVLISEKFASYCSQPLAALGRHPMRGAQQALALFTLPELAAKETRLR